MSTASRLLVSVLAATLGTAGLTAAQKPIARFTTTAVNLEASQGTATSQMEILIRRWSTDAERDQLANAVNEQGQAKVLSTLGRMKPVGTIGAPDTVGYNVRYARQTKLGTSDRIVLVAERPMAHWELRQGGKSTEYPFTIIELRIGPDGKGEGRMSYATKLLVDRATNLQTLENYNSSPVLLNNVVRDDE